MKYISFILSILLFNITQFSYAQCDCPNLPEDRGDIYKITTVDEMWNALDNVDKTNGSATLILEEGTYLLKNRFMHIKNNMSNVTIRSKSGNRDDVIIKGEGYKGNTPHVFLVAAPNFILADVTIGWVTFHGVQIQGENNADNPLIQNVRFVNTKEQMLKVSGRTTSEGSNNGIIQCCLFEFPDGVAFQFYTGGIDAHNATDWIVRNNTFKHIRSPESKLAEHAIHFWSNSKNTKVENNWIIDCDRGIGFGLGNNQHFGGTIRNNFVHTSRDIGIGLESSVGVKVYNNTVITDNYFNSIEYRFDATNDAHIVNNLTNKNVASRQGGTGLLETNIKISDLSIFVDADNYDYHLKSNISTIVDRGTDIKGMNFDYDCHDRIAGWTIDIGADEFNSIITTIEFETRLKNLSVYPNPSDGRINITSPYELDIRIYNMDGHLILTKHLLEGNNELNFAQKGMFFITSLNNVDEINMQSRFVIR